MVEAMIAQLRCFHGAHPERLVQIFLEKRTELRVCLPDRSGLNGEDRHAKDQPDNDDCSHKSPPTLPNFIIPLKAVMRAARGDGINNKGAKALRFFQQSWLSVFASLLFKCVFRLVSGCRASSMGL